MRHESSIRVIGVNVGIATECAIAVVALKVLFPGFGSGVLEDTVALKPTLPAAGAVYVTL